MTEEELDTKWEELLKSSGLDKLKEEWKRKYENDFDIQDIPWPFVDCVIDARVILMLIEVNEGVSWMTPEQEITFAEAMSTLKERVVTKLTRVIKEVTGEIAKREDVLKELHFTED